MAAWRDTGDTGDAPETFEKIRDTSHGDGSAKAANKGKIKRRYKFARIKHKRHGKKAS